MARSWIRRLPSAAGFCLIAAALLWSAAVWLAAAGTDISTDYDKTFSFAGVTTWAWHPEGAGDVRLAVSSSDDPKRVAAVVDPVIIPAVERELAARKLSPAPPERADVYVHYYVLVTVKHEAQHQGQFLAPTLEWGLPPFAPSTTSLSVYPIGTLLIDVASPAKKAVVWRGAARRKIDLERPDRERRRVLEQAIRDLIRRFPPKR
jgi:hypothetical protein